MSYPLTITTSAMRAINRSAVLEIVRRESPISRTTIAERLEISLPTVMRIVDTLLDEGLIRLQGESEWSGGRRRPLLEFNSDGFLILGVDMGGTHLYGAISDLGGNVIAEASAPRRAQTSEENYECLVALIDTLLASPQLAGRQVRGMGVGAPGITLHGEGVVKWAYSLNWRDFPLKARLFERYHLPVIVDNDVNLAALGELWFGVGINASNMIYITLGNGIGAGIIINRALYQGSNQASGEIGHMIPDAGFLGGDFQDFGALESAASGTAIVQRARLALQSRRSPEELDRLVAEDVFEAARQGQKWASRIIMETIDYLALTVANLSVSFDPDLIVLGGGLSGCAPMLVEPILQRIQKTIPTPPRLVVSKLGLRAAVMGAITNVLYDTSNFFVVQKLS